MLDFVSIFLLDFCRYLMICFEDKAPVCKSLMIYVGCSHAATHIPSLAPVFRKIFTESIGIESTKSLLRLIASKLVFPDSRSTILVCFLVYFFRILERRSGSLKFSSNLATSWILGLSLDLLLSPTLPDPWSPYLTPGNFINCHQCTMGKFTNVGRPRKGAFLQLFLDPKDLRNWLCHSVRNRCF